MEAGVIGVAASGAVHDYGYPELLVAVQARNTSGPLFTTNAEGVFAAFLAGLPDHLRQHYTCHACRRFVEAYGGLVRLDPDGEMVPAMWPPLPPAPFEGCVAAVMALVGRATVTGVFLSSAPVWGTPVTGAWKHLHATNAAPFRATKLKTATQAMAEKAEDFGMISRALVDYTVDHVRQAVRLLKMESLYRSEKCLGVAEWLLELRVACVGVLNVKMRDRLIWRAVATAPVGYAHVRTSMIGTLLDDIAAGLPFEDVAAKFAAKMHPLGYQRPKAAPTAGAVARAEKIIAELHATGSLARRFARLSDVRTVWTPASLPAITPPGGVFGHLLPKAAEARQLDTPAQVWTWEKFRREVLPEAVRMEMYVPASRAPFCALVTAVNPDAPPILQWDSLQDRNPVSWYMYVSGSTAAQWNLRAGTWAAVTAIALKPSMWPEKPLAHHGEGLTVLLSGARDLKSAHAGAALFPEILRSELREVRKVIEEYSRRAEIEGAEAAEACGMMLAKGDDWPNAPIRVTCRDGSRSTYRLDRWD